MTGSLSHHVVVFPKFHVYNLVGIAPVLMFEFDLRRFHRTREVISEAYELEYGSDCMEMHVGAVEPGERVLVIDDLVATGGTLSAGIRLLGWSRLFFFMDFWFQFSYCGSIIFARARWG